MLFFFGDFINFVYYVVIILSCNKIFLNFIYIYLCIVLLVFSDWKYVLNINIYDFVVY